MKKNSKDPVDTIKEKELDNRYKTELCKTFEYNSYCPYGNKCRFAHGKTDLFEKSDKVFNYKKTNCKSFHGNFSCIYGTRCLFKHTETFDKLDRSFWLYLINLREIYEIVNLYKQKFKHKNNLNKKKGNLIVSTNKLSDSKNKVTNNFQSEISSLTNQEPSEIYSLTNQEPSETDNKINKEENDNLLVSNKKDLVNDKDYNDFENKNETIISNNNLKIDDLTNEILLENKEKNEEIEKFNLESNCGTVKDQKIDKETQNLIDDIYKYSKTSSSFLSPKLLNNYRLSVFNEIVAIKNSSLNEDSHKNSFEKNMKNNKNVLKNDFNINKNSFSSQTQIKLNDKQENFNLGFNDDYRLNPNLPKNITKQKKETDLNYINNLKNQLPYKNFINQDNNHIKNFQKNSFNSNNTNNSQKNMNNLSNIKTIENSNSNDSSILKNNEHPPINNQENNFLLFNNSFANNNINNYDTRFNNSNLHYNLNSIYITCKNNPIKIEHSNTISNTKTNQINNTCNSSNNEQGENNYNKIEKDLQETYGKNSLKHLNNKKIKTFKYTASYTNRHSGATTKENSPVYNRSQQNHY